MRGRKLRRQLLPDGRLGEDETRHVTSDPGMIAAGPHTVLDAPPVSVRVSALDGEAAGVVDLLSRVMRAGPSKAGGVEVYVHASRNPPAIGDSLDSWRSYVVRERVVIRESPSRETYLCGVPGYPDAYPSPQLRWHLASFVACGVLSLLAHRLLLIHAALVTQGDEGYVLAGESGAGKSTAAARLPPPWRAPADDLLAAVMTPGGYALVPLPTWSVFDRDAGGDYAVETGRPFPLAGLRFLEQSGHDGAAPLAPTPAVQRLVENVLPVYGHYWSGLSPRDLVRLRGEVFAHARRITAAASCGVLGVSRTGRFWECLRDG